MQFCRTSKAEKKYTVIFHLHLASNVVGQAERKNIGAGVNVTDVRTNRNQLVQKRLTQG